MHIHTFKHIHSLLLISNLVSEYQFYGVHKYGKLGMILKADHMY